MELMVDDYLKHMSKAFVAMQDCITRYDALRIAAAMDGLGAGILSSLSQSLPPSFASWQSFIMFLNGDDTEDPLEDIKAEDDECRPEQDSLPSNQDDNQPCSVKTASYHALASLMSAMPLPAIDSNAREPLRKMAKAHGLLLPMSFAKERATAIVRDLLLQVKRGMAPIVAIVFRSGESTLVPFTASMVAVTLMALYVWCALARMHESWGEIAAAQRSSQEELRRALELLAAQNAP